MKSIVSLFPIETDLIFGFYRHSQDYLEEYNDRNI